MLTSIHPKLPMRSVDATKTYYKSIGFAVVADYGNYLIVERDDVQIHFFEFKTLKPEENYGQAYIRTGNIDQLYQSFLSNNISIHPNAPLETKPWGQREFSLLDPDHNLLTFGQTI